MRRHCPLLTLLLALALVACGEADDHAAAASDEAHAAEHAEPGERPTTPLATDDPAEPTIVDGVQVVEIQAGRMGYVPPIVALQAGLPARLVFTRTVDSECSSQVQIPDMGVPVTDLPMNEPVAVEFTPEEGGEYAFVCGMDMQRGSILVRS